MERCRSGHNGTVSKTDRGFHCTWVRIPLSPPIEEDYQNKNGNGIIFI